MDAPNQSGRKKAYGGLDMRAVSVDNQLGHELGTGWMTIVSRLPDLTMGDRTRVR